MDHSTVKFVSRSTKLDPEGHLDHVVLLFSLPGVPLLFWLILFLKRRSGVDEKFLVMDEPLNTQLKARLVAEMRQDIVHRGLHMEEEKLQTFEKDLLTEYLYSKKLNVSDVASSFQTMRGYVVQLTSLFVPLCVPLTRSRT